MITLGYMLIDSNLDGAMVIVYGICEAVVVNDRDSSATA